MTVNGNLNAQKYRDDIFTPVVLAIMNADNGVAVLQQDKARPKTVRAITQS